MELNLAPPVDRNRTLPKFLIAGLVMIAVAVAVYMLNPRKTAEISVQKIAIFAPHTEFKAIPGQNRIIGERPSTEDDLYLVATLRIADKLRIPLFFDSVSATMTTAEGATIDATVVSPQDLSGLEETFPQILPMVSDPTARPLNFDDSIAPGAARVGSVVLLFPQVSAEAWQKKRSATLALRLEHDDVPLTVALH